MKALRVGLLAGAAAIGLASTALAADPIYPIDDVVYEPVFDFEGPYIGIYGGAGFVDMPVDVYGVGGGMVGFNFTASEGVLLGIELQGGFWTDGNNTAFDGYILGRLGIVASDMFMLYGSGGVGAVGTTPVFAFGGGVEAALSDNLGVRAEGLFLTEWDFSDSAVKATLGLVWYLD